MEIERIARVAQQWRAGVGKYGGVVLQEQQVAGAGQLGAGEAERLTQCHC